MHSEFYNVALDRIRYSLVWEDSDTLYNALDINENDQLLIITSAGCNVLNALLKNPAAITAIDLNPVQNKLLLLKKHVIANHSYEVYYNLLGLGGKDAVEQAKQLLLETLPVNEQKFWLDFFNSHPDGLLTSGRLEHYITDFYKTLGQVDQQNLLKLISFDNIKEQYNFFIDQLDKSSFKNAFINYFDDENLSKGRDPKLLKYAEETGGQAFYQRLLNQVQTCLVSSNFYFRFFFFGIDNLPRKILPPCYQRENYSSLKKHINKLSVVTGEAVDYLLSTKGKAITKASLSNIFEYTSQQEFERVCTALSAYSNRSLQIVFWNLLNEQGRNLNFSLENLKVEKVKSSDNCCFYFKNVLQLQYNPATTPKPIFSE